LLLTALLEGLLEAQLDHAAGVGEANADERQAGEERRRERNAAG
jgi:hypothetical protein